MKSTEPYIDDYFTLDIQQVMVEAGFAQPAVTVTSPRHYTLIAQVRK